VKAPTNNLLFIARVHVCESRARRLRDGHLKHQMEFSWTLMNWAANARRKYIESKKPVELPQGSLF
jgi:hypothetical protein